MLSLRDIVKTYTSGDSEVHALRGVSIDFRESEFVSILGPSGCGKTTMLNIIGGLDRYTSGDLIIGGRSTKEFHDADWDTYRNHSIGFVFQSYNLIMHQTVLANVELALTLSGVSREERRARAIDALEQVGLGDQLHKKPNQMSGGQMQRVAIARALVNDPDILLADEPTGALDTVTSVQIMEILKKVSEKKLIIMVTHNPELAAEYSNRIIRVLDGQVIDDTNPYVKPLTEEVVETSAEEVVETSAEEVIEPLATEVVEAPVTVKKPVKKGKKSMSFLTALSLSFTNLLTKKTRTLLVSIAGSIGIIGIALILALSNGVNLFIASVQEETLTSYPISLTAQTSDLNAMMSAMVGTDGKENKEREPGKVYVDDSISNMVGAMTSMKKNNLASFRKYLESRYGEIKNDITAIQYSYNMDLQIFNASTQFGKNGVMQVSPSKVLSDFSEQNAGLSGIVDNISIFSEIMPGRDGELINATVYEQYNLVDGAWPKNANELVLVVDRNNTVSNIALYMLGMLNPDEMTAMMAAMMLGEKYDAKTEGMEFSFEDFYKLDLNLAYNSDFYAKNGSVTVNGAPFDLWKDLRGEENFLPENVYDGGRKLKIVGVIAPNPDATSTSIQGVIGYTSALTDAVLTYVNDSEIVKQQIANPDYDVFTGLPFHINDADKLTVAQKADKLAAYISSLPADQKVAAYLGLKTDISDKQMAEYLAAVREKITDKKQFLIDLYGFNSKNGSLAVGSTANDAIANILLVIVPEFNGQAMDFEKYQKLVAEQYAPTFGLDGEALEPGNAAYDKYEGLISTLYDTDEKIAAAFDNMTAMTIEMVYPMVENVNLQTDLMTAHITKMMGEYRMPQAQIGYLVNSFCAANGIAAPDTDPVAIAYRTSLESLLASPMTAYTVTQKFMTEVQSSYMAGLANPDFYHAEAAAYVDTYLETMAGEGATAEDEATFAAYYEAHMQTADHSYEETLELLGATAGYDALTAINLYPVNFEAKERLNQMIKDYNATVEEEDQIDYTDIVAIMMSSVTIIIDAISYVLIAFVSISLVVSSIMIGIITYISVLERTKEIGVLRAIGASKRDISRVFNAETLIIGFAAGAIGILTTVLLCIPINIILRAVTDMNNIKAVLPVGAAFILVGISMALTLIAGLIPSRIAAKKDPVEALRSE